MGRSPRGIGALVLILGLLAVGCGTRPPPAGRGATVALLAAPTSFSPILDRSPAGRQLQDAMFRSFVEYDDAGRLVADWAMAPPSAKDGTFRSLGPALAQYRFVLRPDARWSDSWQMNAEDFLFAYRMAVHPLLRRGHDYWTKTIRQMSAEGGVTLVVERSSKLDTIDVFPLPSHLLEPNAMASPSAFQELDFHSHPVGNGPYMLESGGPSDARLVRNPYYAPRVPMLDVVRVKTYGHADDALTDLEKGGVDVVADLPPERARQWTPPEGVNLVTVAGPSLVLLAFNTRDVALRHRDVRAALATTLDRPALASAAAAIPAQSWLQPGRAGYQPAFESYKGGLEAARKAFQASGWKADSQGRLSRAGQAAPVVILAPEQQRPLGESLQKAWNALGLQVRLDVKAGDDYDHALRRRQFSAAVQEVSVLPWTQPSVLFSRSAIPTARNRFVGENVSGWFDAAHETLLSKIATAPEPSSATGALEKEQAALARDVPLVPLFFRPQYTATRAALAGVAPRGWGSITWNVESWHF